MARFALGIEFAEMSARLLVARDNGEEAAAVDVQYPGGVMNRQLPDRTPLGRDWALQDPRDYLLALRDGVPRALAAAKVSAGEIAGVGVAFPGSTVVATLADATPLCVLPRFAGEPHAWVKIASHQAARREAIRVTSTLDPVEFPGVSCAPEWFFAKVAQMAGEAPAVYQAAERLIEAGDWIVWQMTGGEARGQSIAGFRSLWRKERGFPGTGLCEPSKLGERYLPLGSRAGELTGPMAEMTGLRAGTPVAVATLAPHAAVVGCGVNRPGTMVLVFDDALHALALGAERRLVPGCASVVEDGLIPGFWAYEARPVATRAWSEWCATTFAAVAEKPAATRPGKGGLLAVDREGELVVAGISRETTAAEIGRALVQLTAFTVRSIIDDFEKAAVAAGHPLACGDAASARPEILQTLADATGREVRWARSAHATAFGAAIHGAVAGGLFAGLAEAADRMGAAGSRVYRPEEGVRENYDRLYDLYLGMRGYFTGAGVLDRLARLRAEG